MAQWLTAVRFASITLELCLLFNRLSMGNSDALVNPIQEALSYYFTDFGHLLALCREISMCSQCGSDQRRLLSRSHPMSRVADLRLNRLRLTLHQ